MGLRAQISGSYVEPEILKKSNHQKLIQNQNAESSVKMFDVQICWFAVFARIALYAAAVRNKEKVSNKTQTSHTSRFSASVGRFCFVVLL